MGVPGEGDESPPGTCNQIVRMVFERAALVLPLLSGQLAHPFPPTRLQPAGRGVPPQGGGSTKSFELVQMIQVNPFKGLQETRTWNTDNTKGMQGEYEGNAKETQRINTGHAIEL